MLGARELQGARVLQSTRELQGVPVLRSTHELQVKRVCRTRGRDAYYPPSGKKEEAQSIKKNTRKRLQDSKLLVNSEIQTDQIYENNDLKKKKTQGKIKQNKTETYEKPSQ